MKKAEEKALLYRFRDKDNIAAVEAVFQGLHIMTEVVPDEAWHQKVGYLLGMQGFCETKLTADDLAEDFTFPHEVMVLYKINGKRLDMVLQALHEAGVAPIRYKAVVTPFNTLWTLRRLCETMQREHGMIKAQGVDVDE
jgi:hypothetical protein